METKICIICPTIIKKPVTCSKREWENRKYCSHKCKGIAQETLYKGKNNPCYRGGRIISTLGYVEILIPEHPFANNRGYVYEHRLVMERKLERLLGPKEIVHHINKNLADNRPENLKFFNSIGSHMKHELTGIPKPYLRGISLSKKHKHNISIGLKRFHANRKSL